MKCLRGHEGLMTRAIQKDPSLSWTLPEALPPQPKSAVATVTISCDAGTL